MSNVLFGGSDPQTYKAVFSYNGKYFHGVAEQNDSSLAEIPTVLGALREVIEMVAQSPVHIAVAGRTDKGVHARAQVLSFSVPDVVDIDVSRLQHVCNQRLAPNIVVTSLIQAEPEFHARFSAKNRTYRYFIDNSDQPNFSMADFAWRVAGELDVEAMDKAAQHFVGQKDFSSVCRDSDDVKHNVREVFRASMVEPPQPIVPVEGASLLCFEISANAFCWQMVRSIVGILVLVGKGQISPYDIEQILKAKKRQYGGQIAPAHGLVLWSVEY